MRVVGKRVQGSIFLQSVEYKGQGSVNSQTLRHQMESPVLTEAMADNLMKNKPFRIRLAGRVEAHNYRTDTDFAHWVQGTVIDINPSQMMRETLEQKVQRVLGVVVGKFESKMQRWQDLPDYLVLPKKVSEITLDFGPTHNLLREYSLSHHGQGWRALPPELLKKRACINPTSYPSDNRCFAYAVMCHFLRGSDMDITKVTAYTSSQTGKRALNSDLPKLRPVTYMFQDTRRTLNFDNLNWKHLNTEEISKFEGHNPGIGIYVMEYRDGYIHQLRTPSMEEDSNIIEIILLLHNHHYSYVNHFQKLMSSPLTASQEHSRFYCHRCMEHFYSHKQLQQHLTQMCKQEELVTKVLLPETLTYARFEKPHMLHRHPARVYWDCESYPDPETNVNIPVSYAWSAHGVGGWVPPLEKRMHVNGNPHSLMQAFLLDMFRLLKSLKDMPDYPLNMPFNDSINGEEQYQRDCLRGCYVCGSLVDLCRDHNHLIPTANYRGAACRSCNARMKKEKSIVCFAHNGSKFDHCFLFRAFSQLKAQHQWLQAYEWNIIPKTKNVFLAMSLGNQVTGRIIFADSLRFLNSSLEKLIESRLQDGTHAFPILRQRHPYACDENMRDILQKIPFPYSTLAEPVDTWKDLPGVPPQSSYNNVLRNTVCSDREYAEIQALGRRLRLHTFEKTHRHYLWTDVLGLADVMEDFSATWHRIFGICPFHSVTIASAAYQSCLKWIGPVIQVPSHDNGGMDFVDLIDRSILGGLVWAKEVYCKPLPHEELCALDLTSLYPTVQAKYPLPVGNFVKLEASYDLAMTLLQTWTFEDEFGYLIECDFHVPQEYHDMVDLPPVGKFTLTEDWLTEDQKRSDYTPGRKLIPYLGQHKGSGRHIALLQTWMKHCHIEILAVHSIWRFDQRKVFSSFVQELFDLRQKQTTETGRSVIKVGLNSVWGKTLEDQRKHTNTQLCSNPGVFQKKVARKACKDFCILDHNDFLGTYSSCVATVKLDRPKQIAWAVLDLSKVMTYTWWYGIKDHWKGARLMYTDTDSFYVLLPEPLIPKALEWNKSHLAETIGTFDLGKAAPSPGAVLGSLKNELEGNRCIEAIFLGSKMYALWCERRNCTKAKGIPKCVIGPFEEYKRMLELEAVPQTVEYHTMRVKQCQSMLVTEKKKGLSFTNDKVKIWRDGDTFRTRPHGHFLDG